VIAAAVALAAVLAGPPAPAGRAGPVRVDADEVRYVYPKRQVIFTGKPLVRLVRDDGVLTCKRLVATTDEAGRIGRAVCTGDVRFERGPKIVTCESATYEDAAGRIICEGSPVLKDGASEARGERLVYELATDEVTMQRPVIEVPAAEVEAHRKELEARRRKEAKP
jgi:lipopolysaccharide export system protein LptA